jgi:hypothetical protein
MVLFSMIASSYCEALNVNVFGSNITETMPAV